MNTEESIVKSLTDLSGQTVSDCCFRQLGKSPLNILFAITCTLHRLLAHALESDSTVAKNMLSHDAVMTCHDRL